MVHRGKTARKKLNSLSKRQLISLLMMVLTTLKMGNPRAYAKLERRAGLAHASRGKRHRKHRGRRHRKHRKHRGGKHRLRAGVHSVRIRGKMRKVRVLENGRWRFLKS